VEFVAISARSWADLGLIPPSSAAAGADGGEIKPVSARDWADIPTKSH
jgi:hypothetical protein